MTPGYGCPVSTISGLPAHVLLVHAVVVLLPLAALLLVLTVLWPAARSRLAPVNVVLAVGVTALVPVTTSAGEWLQARVESTEVVREHTELGDTALWVALPVAVLALIVWWRARRPSDDASHVVGVVVTVLAVLAAGAAVYDVYLIGDSGARATWQDGFSPTPLPPVRQG